MRASLASFKETPQIIYNVFDALNTWGHPREEKRVLWAIGWRSSACNWSKLEEFNHSLSSKCARAYGHHSEGQVKSWELVTLGVWQHLDDLGDREVLGGLLEIVGAPRREDCTWYEARHFGDGEWVFLVKTSFLVMQESDTHSRYSNVN